MPIIELQRRMVEAGRIRAGDRAEGSDGKLRPRKLAYWRLTSKDRTRLEEAAKRWGGQVRAWAGHEGEWELYTETNELAIMLIPGHEPSTWYELWSAGGCQRRCDGVHEMVSDATCLCGEERECKPITRLSVMLPDLPGIGSWLVSSTGWNAAAELTGTAALLAGASAGGSLVPARLRLEQRTSVKGGTTRRFAVPVIDIDLSVRELLGLVGPSRPIEVTLEERVGNGSGYTPLPELEPHSRPTLAAGLAAVAEREPHRGPKSPPALPVVEDVAFEEAAVPVPEEMPGGESGPTTPRGASAAETSGDTSAGTGLGDDAPVPSPPGAGGDPISPAQKKKLNVLVGTLREKPRPDGLGAALTTEQVWFAVASQRGIELAMMEELLHGRDEEGVLHWSPLRESLSKREASELIDRLEKYEANLP